MCERRADEEGGGELKISGEEGGSSSSRANTWRISLDWEDSFWSPEGPAERGGPKIPSGDLQPEGVEASDPADEVESPEA